MNPTQYPKHYAIAVASVAVALLLMLALDPLLNLTQASFLLFFGAITLSALYGGRQAGILATLLSALLSNYYFLAPQYTWALTLPSGLRMVLFILEGILISLLVGSLRVAQEQIRRNFRQLEATETEIKDLNQALQRRVNELQTLFNVIPINIAIAEDPECRTIKVNPAFSQLLRISPQANASVTPPEQAPQPAYKVYQNGQEMAKRNLPQQYAAKHGVELRDLELDIVHNDGSVFNLYGHAVPLFDEMGQPRGSVAVYIDISERKQAEAAMAADLKDTQLLRDLSMQLTTANDSQALHDKIMMAAIALMQADAGTIQILEPATQELVLLAAHGFAPTTMQHFYRVDGRAQTSCDLALNSRTRSFVDFDRPPPNDGPDDAMAIYVEAGFLSAQSTPLLSRSGQLIGMVSTYWHKHHRPTERELRFLDLLVRQAADLIEQHRAEVEREELLAREQTARQDAERANRIKDEFLAILSHELRSPLNPILGWSKLLQTRTLDPARTQQALATIERNAKLQTQLIDDLLDVARILRGKLSLAEARVTLGSVIEAALDVVRMAAEAKAITLHADLIDVCQVWGDEGRLQQVVWNLLANGIKFTPEGGRVDIRLESVHQHAQITVADTGRGISPQFLPHLFESFRQEDVSITRQHGGLGLGLSIVKYLVDAHGGTITADSPGEDQGATFTIRLPLLQEATPALTSRAYAPSAVNLTGIRVLAVDDSDDARLLLSTLLQQFGAEVRVLATAAAMLDQLDSFQPDVLVCDISMPEMDGYSLLDKIRSLPPERGGTLPAIALTAYAGEDDRQKAMAHGFQRHIAKPLELDTLATAIAQLARGQG